VPSLDRDDADGSIERIVRDCAGAGGELRNGSTWLTVLPDGFVLPEHGWKLHVSSQAETFVHLAEVLVPVVVAEGCAFKLARSPEVLRMLNDGMTSPAAVGKAFTLYPNQEHVREFGLRLAEMLSGHRGPRVLSDRRVLASSPVYYRYGPFVAAWRATARGQLETRIDGPGGAEFQGRATMRYRQPSWAVDPFTGEAADGPGPGAAGPGRIGGHYRIVEGVSESARGNVFRAVDERTGTTVIIKQARALVAEHDGLDTRMRLRNERRILQALAGLRGVPQFVDHFRHGDDEFLVISDCGACSLTEDVLRNGPYRWAGPGDGPGVEPGGPHSLDELAAELARIVAGLHDRGVIARDISPKNVVINGTAVSLIDFGHAACGDGLTIPGGTAGYSPARQLRGDPPVAADDLYSLGMTLLFAAHGADPVYLGQDPDLPQLRARQDIRASWGAAPEGVPGAIADLIGDDRDRAADAFRRLAGDPAGRGPAAARTPLPALPELTPDLVGRIADNLRADLLAQANALLTTTVDRPSGPDASLYSGSAGIGRELIHHIEHPGVADCLERLVGFTLRASREVELAPGLFVGSTGVSIFLHEAAARGVKAASGTDAVSLPTPQWRPEGDDLISGAAGVGLGHLWLYRATGNASHLEVARRCAEELMDGSGPDQAVQAEELPDSAALDRSAGRAHGLAGFAEFLLSYAEATGDERVHAHAAGQIDQLAKRASSLIGHASGPGAVPLAFSWCQGLPGIARTLRHASVALDRPELGRMARWAADVCTAQRSRIVVTGQCCGGAGVGSLLAELAAGRDGERYRAAAYDVAVRMLLRSGGPPEHPMFTEDSPGEGSASWALGVAGILAFFRQLRTCGRTKTGASP
jgi:serine/threonine protein kinase